MNIPADLKYTKDHEWARIEDDTATIGITDFAQGELGDIVFIEMPQVGGQIRQGDSCGSIEAVKAVSDLFTPLSGEVLEVNGELESDPQLINQDAYGRGWIFRIRLSDAGEEDGLLTAKAYQELIG
ncbi:MAG TPA: glycine cleavage system protein GcvH [bacterium]|nr:glycine cleavage system protein GcvH [bacterium]